jgi:hypothetical protein
MLTALMRSLKVCLVAFGRDGLAQSHAHLSHRQSRSRLYHRRKSVQSTSRPRHLDSLIGIGSLRFDHPIDDVHGGAGRTLRTATDCEKRVPRARSSPTIDSRRAQMSICTVLGSFQLSQRCDKQFWAVQLHSCSVEGFGNLMVLESGKELGGTSWYLYSDMRLE